jgi:hypothetical protein
MAMHKRMLGQYMWDHNEREGGRERREGEKGGRQIQRDRERQKQSFEFFLAIHNNSSEEKKLQWDESLPRMRWR